MPRPSAYVGNRWEIGAAESGTGKGSGLANPSFASHSRTDSSFAAPLALSAGTQWLHEIKHDGYRTQLHLSPFGRRAFTRRGHDWSHLYRLILRDAERLASNAVLDGEVIIKDEHGRSDFDSLKDEMA